MTLGEVMSADSESKESTIRELAAEVARLRDRAEDLEDARELDAVIQRNGDKPLVSWDQAKASLGLE